MFLDQFVLAVPDERHPKKKRLKVIEHGCKIAHEMSKLNTMANKVVLTVQFGHNLVQMQTSSDLICT